MNLRKIFARAMIGAALTASCAGGEILDVGWEQARQQASAAPAHASRNMALGLGICLAAGALYGTGFTVFRNRRRPSGL